MFPLKTRQLLCNKARETGDVRPGLTYGEHRGLVGLPAAVERGSRRQTSFPAHQSDAWARHEIALSSKSAARAELQTPTPPGAKTTDAGVKKLKQAAPNCEIRH